MTFAIFSQRPANSVLLLWLAIGALIPVLPGFDDRRLLLTAALGLVCIYGLFGFRAIVPSVVLACTGMVIIALGTGAAITSAAPAWSLLGIAYPALCAFSIATLANGVREFRTDFAPVMGVGFVLPLALYCVMASITVYSGFLSGIPLRYPEPLREFANIRFFNQYQTWLLPFLPAALTLVCPLPRVRQTLWQAFVITVAVFFWALFWRSSGRGTGYGTLLATLAVAAFLGRAGRTHAVCMATFAAAGYMVNLIMFGMGTNARLITTESPGRWYLWQIAVEKITEHPWLGIGPMLYAGIDNGIASHPHSAPLQWAVEWGIPAATLIVAVICWLLYRWLVTARRLTSKPANVPPSLIAAVTASLLAGTLHALVSGVIVMPPSQFLLVTVAGLAVGIVYSTAPLSAKRETSTPPRIGSAALWLILLASVAYTLPFTAYDYFTRVRSTPPQTQTAAHLRNSYQPRYWADGTLTSMVEEDR